ncbi:dynamin family protein [Actinomycetospora lemnae]|uniref:Dynamin family protein n=1 Tax=Actinomycetospora lemnae TaxID=3019891 RepID=A0ABT5SSI3_9PSEU|nr:dynamin family protein [Actinomycetospora sp. DW7H6]MDD7965797.1 dynamin family protein [Actinomycetospora sp. DW7H6]
MTGPAGPVGPVTSRLVALCTGTRDRLRTPELRERLDGLVTRLSEPRIRVAVGGRMNAGKSTLANALLQERLAATGATETTRLVTWFRHGHQARVRVHHRDGRERVLPLAATGGVGATVTGAEAAEVGHLTVETPNDALTRYTLIDTPGMDSLSKLDPDSLAALGDADAVVYLMPHPGERDAEAIEAVRGWSGGLRLGAANMIGVLSRIDTLSDEDDPWPTARRVADRYARELRAVLSDVVPVAGLLAETARGPDFSETDARALRTLAEADRGGVGRKLRTVQRFRAWADAPLPADDRERLLDLLGLHGIRVALELLDEGRRSTPALLEGLAQRSGVAELIARIDTVFVAGADRLRASAGIAALEHLGWDAADEVDRRALLALQSELDRLRLEPALRQVDLASALVDLEAGRMRLGDEDTARLRDLATGPDDAHRLGLPAGADPATIAAAAAAQIPQWRRLEARPSRVLQRHVRTARELCEHMLFTERPAADAAPSWQARTPSR